MNKPLKRTLAALLCMAMLGMAACSSTPGTESSAPVGGDSTTTTTTTESGLSTSGTGSDSTTSGGGGDDLSTTLPPIASTTQVGDPTKAPTTAPTTQKVQEYPEDLGSGTTYYVSASAGNDQNDGKSPQTPFKTAEAVNALTLKAGDNVLFKRGDVFTGAHLVLNGMGEAKEGKWITLDAYGIGANPVFKEPAQVAPAISLTRMTTSKGYRIRHLDIDGYRQGICVKKTSMELAFDGLVISDCTIQNITLNKQFHDGDRANLPNGAALAFGIWLYNVKNVTVKNVTLKNTDCPIQVQGGEMLFDNIDMFNCPMQGVMIYGATGGVDYDTLMKLPGTIIFQNSRIRYVGYRCGTWGSTGFLVENTVGCIIKNVEISHVINSQAGYDSCAIDWEQSNVNCTIEDVYAHDCHGPFVLALEHAAPADGNSRGNVIKNCVSVNNALHGNGEVGSFINISGGAYDNSNQKITIQNCIDIGRPGSSAAMDSDVLVGDVSKSSKVTAKNMTTGVMDVYENFDTASLGNFATATNVTVDRSHLTLKKGAVLRTKFSGSGYHLSVYLKGSVQLVFMSKDAKNGYVWDFEKGKIVAQKRVGGKLTTLKTVAVSGFDPSGWFRVRVETEGKTIRTYIDEQLVNTLTDGTFSSGAVGLTADGTGYAEQLMVWRLAKSSRSLETYAISDKAAFGEIKFAGNWHEAETNWTPVAIKDWLSRPYEAGWGVLSGAGATLTKKNVNVTVTGYNKVQLILMNGSNSGKVYLEFSKDKGKTWHSKAVDTAYSGNDTSYWAFEVRTFHKYTVDMSDMAEWTGKITGLRLRFEGSEGRIGVKTVTIHK
ncbi:MAG: hypothetical protein IJZ13_04880 [Clostridia bacterium]|nr:hypothetical protein [Clostridia bacterium]